METELLKRRKPVYPDASLSVVAFADAAPSGLHACVCQLHSADTSVPLAEATPSVRCVGTLRRSTSGHDHIDHTPVSPARSGGSDTVAAPPAARSGDIPSGSDFHPLSIRGSVSAGVPWSSKGISQRLVRPSLRGRVVVFSRRSLTTPPAPVPPPLHVPVGPASPDASLLSLFSLSPSSASRCARYSQTPLSCTGLNDLPARFAPLGRAF